MALGDGAGDITWPGGPRIGDVLGGKYRVEGALGSGGMGIVLAAEQLHLKRRVAVKILRPDASAESTTRFLREAQAAASIESEHVARVIDVCETAMKKGAPSHPCLVMEKLEGRDLRRILEEDGPLAPELAVAYIAQASKGIAEAHAKGFVHRDIKPANLFVTTKKDGSPLVKVLDFGISKVVRSRDTETKNALTTTQDALGTPAYMSPEHVRSAARVDERSDVWSLGVVLYELLTNRTPFEGESSSAMSAAIVADTPIPLRDRRAGIDRNLERVIMRCLEKDPARRWESASDLARALSFDASKLPPTTKPRWIALVGVAGLVGIVVMLLTTRSSPTAATTTNATTIVASVPLPPTVVAVPVRPPPMETAPPQTISSATRPEVKRAASTTTSVRAPVLHPSATTSPPPEEDPLDDKVLQNRK